MTPLKTETLDLTFNDSIAHITVSGAVARETLEAGLNWMDEVVEANDNFAVRVDMAKDDFADLGEISGEFKNVGRLLRHAVEAEKCAVLTDSLFLRNSAKVEGAVIPGLEINTFAPEAAEVAEAWLKDEPLIEEAPAPETSEQEAPKAKLQSSYGPAPTEIKTVAPSEMKAVKADIEDAVEDNASDNPWGDFRAI